MAEQRGIKAELRPRPGDRAPDPRTPLPPRDPKRGDLRVEGAPPKPPMIPWSGRRFLAILLGLFVLNWLIVAIFAPAEERIRVPYNPTFLEEVRDDNVKEISSRAETVQGEFRKEVRFEGREGEGLRDGDPDLRQ